MSLDNANVTKKISFTLDGKKVTADRRKLFGKWQKGSEQPFPTFVGKTPLDIELMGIVELAWLK